MFCIYLEERGFRVWLTSSDNLTWNQGVTEEVITNISFHTSRNVVCFNGDVIQIWIIAQLYKALEVLQLHVYEWMKLLYKANFLIPESQK